MSNASALIVKFIMERAKVRAEADAVEADDFRIDNISLEDVETAEIPDKAKAARTIDRGVVVGAVFYDARSSSNNRSTHAY